jgi:hypothetical protein
MQGLILGRAVKKAIVVAAIDKGAASVLATTMVTRLGAILP